MAYDYTDVPFRDPVLYALAACVICGFNSHNNDEFNRHECKSGSKEWRLSKARANVVADMIRDGMPVCKETVDAEIQARRRR